MKKKIKEILKKNISNSFLQKSKKIIKILFIKLIKVFEKINFHHYSNPYRDAYDGGKSDKLYRDIEEFINFSNGRYFEIGALDGYFSSPTYSLSVKKNWSGIMVEANHKFLDLLKLYRPNDEIINAACTSFEISKKNKSCKFLDLHHSGEIYHNDETIDQYSEDKLKELGKKIILEDIPLTTVTEVVNNSKVIDNNHINLFVLDVEGHEKEVLDGYDFDKINTDYFLIESRTKEESKNIKLFMSTKGYSLIGQTSSTDYVYKKL